MMALPATNLLAQPVVNHMEEHVVGTVTTLLLCNSTTVSEGSPGINQVWDLSMLTTYHPSNPALDTFRYYILANPSVSPHPTATVIDSSIEGGVTKRTYLNQTGTATYELGQVQDAVPPLTPPTSTFDNPGILIAQQPINYNNVFSCSFTGTAINGAVQSYAHGTYQATVDGYGMLKLPYGNFNNVLRVKVVKDEFDSTNVSAETVVTEYNWYDNDHSKPLLTISSSSTNGANPSVTVKYLLSQTPLLAVQNVQNTEDKLKGCFQNNELVLNENFKQGTTYYVSIVNLLGQTIYNDHFVASGNAIHLQPRQQLAAGMYVVKLMENNKPGISTLKVVKQ